MNDWQTYECKYCGQVILDGKCDCPDAMREQQIREQILRADEAISEMFGERCKEQGYKPVSEDSIDILSAAVDYIANYKLHGAAFVLEGGTKASLVRKGNLIKVERREARKLAQEVE